MDDRRGLHVDTETDVYFLEGVFVKKRKIINKHNNTK